MAVGDDYGLTYVERTKRRNHRERAGNVGAVARRRLAMAQRTFGRDNFGRDVADADEAHAGLFEQAGNARKEPVVAAAEEPDDTRQQTDRRPVEADLAERRPQHRADEQRLAAAFGAEKTQETPRLP